MTLNRAGRLTSPPKTSDVQNFELATFANKALAVRLEFADVQEQLRGEMALSHKQLIMTPKAAAALGRLLV